MIFYIIIINLYYYMYVIHRTQTDLSCQISPLQRISQLQSQTAMRRGGKVPRTNNQSEYIHYNSPKDRVYRQTANSRTINTPFHQTILEYPTTGFGPLVDAHTKLICERTRRATTILRPPLEISQYTPSSFQQREFFTGTCKWQKDEAKGDYIHKLHLC